MLLARFYQSSKPNQALCKSGLQDPVAVILACMELLALPSTAAAFTKSGEAWGIVGSTRQSGGQISPPPTDVEGRSWSAAKDGDRGETLPRQVATATLRRARCCEDLARPQRHALALSPRAVADPA